MNLMLPTARRKDGEKQPCIKIWKFDLRIPFVLTNGKFRR